MKVEEVTISKIKIGERFRYDMGDLVGLAASIKEQGVVQPITITSGMLLLAGGRRLEASKLAGKQKIPAVIREMTGGEIEAREIELLENIQRKDLTWFERASLEKKIYDLRVEKDPEWSQRKQADATDASQGAVSRRISLAEAIEAIPELADCKTEDQAWKAFKRIEESYIVQALEEKAGRRGKDASSFAERHYFVGDAFEGIAGINPGVADFAEVDPPYAIGLKKRKGRNQDVSDVMRYNEVEPDDYQVFVEKMAKEVYRILRDNSFVIWWFGPDWYPVVLKALQDAEFSVSSIPAIWAKTGGGQTASPDTTLASTYEPFFVCRKGQPKVRKAGRANVFHYAPVPAQHKIHPTERPIELMLEILDTFVYPGSLVVVPFLGSGVTLRAAYQRSLIGYGWDLDSMMKKRFLNQVVLDAHKREEAEGAEEVEEDGDTV